MPSTVITAPLWDKASRAPKATEVTRCMASNDVSVVAASSTTLHQRFTPAAGPSTPVGQTILKLYLGSIRQSLAGAPRKLTMSQPKGAFWRLSLRVFEASNLNVTDLGSAQTYVGFWWGAALSR